MAKILRSLAVLAVLALLAAATYGVWYARTPVKAAALPVEFEIPEGIGMRGAARRLEQAGIDVGRKRFEALARFLGTTQDIKAGYYRISIPMTPREILDKLERGEVVQATIDGQEKICLVDFKSGLNGFYKDQRIQITAYAALWNSQHPDRPVDHVFLWSPHDFRLPARANTKYYDFKEDRESQAAKMGTLLRAIRRR